MHPLNMFSSLPKSICRHPGSRHLRASAVGAAQTDRCSVRSEDTKQEGYEPPAGFIAVIGF